MIPEESAEFIPPPYVSSYPACPNGDTASDLIYLANIDEDTNTGEKPLEKMLMEFSHRVAVQ
eukprot:1238032-Pyramimonas_sp.AAC.1